MTQYDRLFTSRDKLVKTVLDLEGVLNNGVSKSNLSEEVQEAINKAENAVSTPEGEGNPGQVLQLDSEGNPSWITPSAGTVPDAELSESSTNAVQNKVITKELLLGAVYDVSVHNSNATFDSLSALLSDINLNILIPTSVRKGGMSVRFINSTSSKYEQWRYTGVATKGTPNPFVDTANWEGGVENSALRYDEAQTLTDAQKAQALANVGIGGIDSTLSASENLVTGKGIVEGTRVKISEILPDTALSRISSPIVGNYYILGGNLYYIKSWTSAMVNQVIQVDFNQSTIYEYGGFRYRYDGTNLIMLSPDIADVNRTTSTIGDVTRTDCIDILPLVTTTGTINSDGSIDVSQNTNYKVTNYLIPVENDTLIRYDAYGFNIYGFTGQSDTNPIKLIATSSVNTRYTGEWKVPEGIAFVRLSYAVKSWFSASFYIASDDTYRFETIDMDVLYPLQSGYYTLSTAIAAFPESQRTINKTLKFKTDASHNVTYTFNSSNVSDWSSEWAWTKDGSQDYNVRGITAETGFKINPIVTNEDLTRDQYIEFVCTTKNRVASGQVYFACSKVFNMRYNAAQLQAYYRGKVSVISTGAPSVADKYNYHHFLLVKSQKDVSGTITHWFDVYIDGVNVSHVDVTDSISSTIPTASNAHFFCPYWDFLVLRAGYYSGDSNGVDAFAASHFNNGNPLAYKDNGELIYEFLPENMHTDYLLNSANKTRSILDASTQPITLLYSNPYDDILNGAGAPESITPKWRGQRYIDTATFNQYLAYNNNNASGWKEIATMNDVNALKSQTKKVNGQSIWGSGDIEGGGSGSGGTTFINVIDNGAVGDGITDDTAAIQTALEKARTQGKALYFPDGTYLTRKSLVLTSNMRVTGEPGAILKSASATLEGGGKCIFTRLTAQALAGATSISVESTTGFVVGQEIVIWSSGSYTETMADITAINGNTITIDTSRFTADGTNGGILNTVANNGYVLTDFAMIKTIMSKPAENVVVENITIMPMSDITEPHIYTSSPISQTKQQSSVAQKNFRVYNVTVYDSANDGISLQGSGESEVVGCRVYNQKHKGIHWGTTHDMIRIHGNYVYGCGSATYDNPNDYYGSGGMFFCVNNSRTIITNNHIENCYRGIYGLNDGDAQDRDAVIANNTITNCGLYGIYIHGGNRVIVNANIFRNFAHGSTPICAEKGGTYNQIATVISNNVISDFNANFDGPAAIKVDGAKHMSITGNLISKQSTSGTQGIIEKGTNTNLVVARGDGIIITGNMVDGNIDISAETNVNVVAANNVYNATT